MIEVRKSAARGQGSYGWLEARYTFSFASYHDPAHMGFRALRVINEDRVAPGAGFAEHGHRDMEIITYVLDGTLAHRDSLGNVATIEAGEVQVMSAGHGIRHSEFNASRETPVHLLQMWILPAREGLSPGYRQRRYTAAEKRGRLLLIAAPEEGGSALPIHQDVRLHAGLLEPGATVEHRFAPGRSGWLQVARGRVALGDLVLEAGDGAALTDLPAVDISAEEPAEILLYDLA